MAGFCPFLVFISSFVNRQSYWKLGTFDYGCGLLSALALLLWAITKDPNVAILFSIVSDALAATPTILKAWRHPETESASGFIGSGINTLTAFPAIQVWNFASFGFPVYLLICNAVLIFSVYRKKVFRSR